MNTAIRIVFASTLSAALAGCLSVGQDETRRYYVLEPPASGKLVQSSPPRATPLLIAPTTGSGFYETTDIVYSRTPAERAYYTQSGWTERPSQRITDLLVSRLERSGAFKTTAYAAGGVQGELVLNTHLASFYHDAATPPGRVRVAIVAELVDAARRALVARKTFEESAPAPTYDAAGAVAAFNQATAAILDEIAQWVDAAAPR